MISIDIQGSLFPNPLTMLVQLLATLLIFLAVKKWLWKPIREILNKRSEAMQASLNDAYKLKEDADKNLSEAKEELKKAKDESLEIVANAKKEANSLKDQIILDAKKEAQNKIEEADIRIANAQKQMEQDLHDEIVSVAISAVEKLLDEKATSKDDQKAIDDFVKEVRK